VPLRVQVVTPEREVVVAEDATFVLAHGVEGDVGILPGHAPLLIALGVGPLTIVRGEQRDNMLVDGGFLQVKDDNVIVLAEYAVTPEEIDLAAIDEEIAELKRRIETEAEREQLQKQLARAEAARRVEKM
jgi:F-type H+-transporting ATPase subunit epsilon